MTLSAKLARKRWHLHEVEGKVGREREGGMEEGREEGERDGRMR